jgi:hypothetical protein
MPRDPVSEEVRPLVSTPANLDDYYNEDTDPLWNMTPMLLLGKKKYASMFWKQDSRTPASSHNQRGRRLVKR